MTNRLIQDNKQKNKKVIKNQTHNKIHKNNKNKLK
jgi:hypothetical protein